MQDFLRKIFEEEFRFKRSHLVYRSRLLTENRNKKRKGETKQRLEEKRQEEERNAEGGTVERREKRCGAVPV